MRTVDPVKHEAKRRQIMAAAAALFARKGFERTTTADICARAGISSGALFHYFPNKRAIFLAIFEQDRRDIAAYLAGIGEDDDPWEALLGLIDIMVDGIEDPEYAGLALEVMAHAGHDEEFAAMVSGFDTELRQALTGLLERAAARGRIDAGLDLAMAAEWISAMADSLFIRAGAPGFVPAEQLRMFHLIVARFLRVETR
ncbi:TetR/AcrR family transcriptional regulator [Allostreptomyces psammosilenae]|uniref:AcrR family transcriptional regulator n=1 Tax=Allostreptomyces psammosilenae TaxID=1892865 RepID=A0A853A3T6_9ACTN|nr:TetR/AcrR family transcriptional regulator [Allostreptomyces psammosilenae]NYI05172.1 AcrR family transcriptional regulator [Allostreptomyces psammosilenae]